jgi:rare lipoprotein A
MQRHTKATLGCVGAIAAAVLEMSSALAASETSSTQPQMQKLEERTTAISVAALDLPTTGPNGAGPNVTVNAAPIPGGPVSDATIIGAASFYDDPGETASGEQYDPTAFTAAAQLKIRDKFGGIKFGRLYQPSYGIAEYAGKKIIIKFNDVGPLRPGRKFDLSRAAMKYFDGIEKGVLPDVKVTVLPLGQVYAAGPVTEEQLVALGLGNADIKIASADANEAFRSGSGRSEVTLPVVPVDTASAPVSLIDWCIQTSREYKATSAAVVQAVYGVMPEFDQDGSLQLDDAHEMGL